MFDSSQIAKAFDDLIGRFGPSDKEVNPTMQQAFDDFSNSIISSIDSQGFSQLCDLIPNLGMICPLIETDDDNTNEAVSVGKVGSGRNRLHYLFHLLISSLSLVGVPILIVMDDLQWADALAIELMSTFTSFWEDNTTNADDHRAGVLLLGGFRRDGVSDESILAKQLEPMQYQNSINVCKLQIDELSRQDVNDLISTKLCLPFRYTRQLSDIVVRKTNGNPFFVVEFLRSLIQNDTLQFSVKSRRWSFDEEVVDLYTMTNDVADLLTKKLGRLDHHVLETLKEASCIGYQVDICTLNLLQQGNTHQKLRVEDALDLAVHEGIVEKAGSIYSFSHDKLKDAIYMLIPAQERLKLHKSIGMRIVRFVNSEREKTPSALLLAVDQINMSANESSLSPDERSQIAQLNLTAGKHAAAASSFEQAREYINKGLLILRQDPSHWESQYNLTLDLFETSGRISTMNGDIEAMPSFLEDILLHARTFEDSLTAR